MKKHLYPSLQRGWLGVLALFLILLTTCTYDGEIRAKPTKLVEKFAPAQELSQEIQASQEATRINIPVSLDGPRPKIDPKLVEELKELKRQRKHQRVRVLLESKDEESFKKIQTAVENVGGKVEQSFNIGDIAVAEVQSDKVEQLSETAGIEQVSSEKEYVAFLSDRIPAFSIDTAAWENNITGKGVKIAILDTGVGPNDKITVAAAESFVSGEDTKDQSGHGTHVAGIAQGVAKDAVIYNAKVLNKNGGGTTSQILAGINWAVEQNVDIISMSFGGMFTELDGPLASAVKEAIDRGVVFVVAAGNCKTGCGGFYGVTTPGNVKEVITAGAVDDNNVVASFSSGDTFDGYIKPDVVAPGVDITSTWLNNGQKTLSGTSMSTPFVAGIAALLLEKEPGLTNAQVKQRLETTATDKGDEGKDVSYGAGIIDVTLLLNGQDNSPEIQPVTETNTSNNGDAENYQDAPPAPFEGYFVEVIEEFSNDTAVQNAEARPAKVSIKMPSYLNYTPVEFIESLPPATISEEEISAQATGNGNVIYWDDYTYQGTSSDGNAWYGSQLETKTSSMESNTKVVCFDWCGNDVYDHCFYNTNTDLSACMTTWLQSFCSTAGKCVVGSMDFWHPISTTINGGPFTCTVKAKYYRNCIQGQSVTVLDAQQKSYYVVDNRRYSCNSQGGTFKDEGYYGVWSALFGASKTCQNGYGCDTAKSPSIFANNGLTEPAKPCSKSDGQPCSSNSECLSSSHCSQVSGQDYCCPAGKEWDGTRCATCTTEICNGVDDNCNGQIDENNVCNPTCSITDAQWIPSGTVTEGTLVTLKAYGTSGCSGRSLIFDILEQDPLSDTLVTSGLVDTTFVNGAFETTWTASWMDDGVLQGDPEYYFVATPDLGNDATSPLLTVTQATSCNNDGRCDSGESKTNCPSDCSKSNGASCTNSNQCASNNCQSGTCQTLVNCNDGDHDNYGSPGSAGCTGGSQTDCDDTKSNINPGVAEVCNNGIDDNCNLQIDENCCPDSDGDGFGNPGMSICSGGSQTDCVNSNPFIYPGAPENCNDSLDNNCNQQINEGCACVSNSNCYSGMGCIFSGYTGTCQPKTCTSQCTSGQLGCKGSTIIQQCKDTNNDGCFEWADLTHCGSDSTCSNGTCTTPQKKTLLSVEDADGTMVNKQPGDIVTIQLTYQAQETITLNYDASKVELLPNSCASNFQITKDMECKFKVKEATGQAVFSISGGTKTGIMNIIKNPAGIILTHKPKLYERYPNDKNTVKKMLQAAYAYAQKNNLILYDLKEYITAPHPWDTTTYNEQWDKSNFDDNTFVLEVAQLIRSKCTGTTCKSTILLGDDYVVPYYRRDVQFLTNNFFTEDVPYVKDIYSDLSYIRTTQKPFTELDDLFYFNGKYDGKKMLFIMPANSNGMEGTINKLKDVLKKKFNPNMEVIASDQVYCNDDFWFSKFNAATIILVGTEENNQAYNCFPFVSGLESGDTAFMDVNPWDGKNYAVVVNTNDPAVLNAFTEFLDKDAYKDGIYLQTKPKAIYFAKFTLKSIQLAATGVSLTLLSPEIPGLMLFGQAVRASDLIAFSASVGDECVLGESGFVCGGTVALGALGFVPISKLRQWLFVDDIIGGLSAAQQALIKTFFPKLKTAFGTEVLHNVLHDIDEHIGIARAAEIFETVWKKQASEFAPQISSKLQRASLLTDMGRIAEESAKGGTKVAEDLLFEHQIEGIDRLTRSIVSKASPGHQYEAKAVRNLIESGSKIKAVSINVPNLAKPGELITEIDALGEKELYEMTYGNFKSGTPEAAIFIEDMGTKYTGYGEYMNQKGLKDYGRVLVLSNPPDDALRAALEGIGWKVRVI